MVCVPCANVSPFPRFGNIAWIETLNVGKPITHSLESLKAMPSSLDYFAGIIPAVRGETIPVGVVRPWRDPPAAADSAAFDAEPDSTAEVGAGPA